MNRQKGFTLVEGLLIVLVLSVIGFAGYYVWNQQQDDDGSSESSQTNNSAKVDSAEETMDNSQEVLETEDTTITQQGWVYVVPDGWNNEDGQVTSPDYSATESPQFAISSGALIRVSDETVYSDLTMDELTSLQGDDYNSASSSVKIEGVELAFRTFEHTTKGESYRGVGKNGKVYSVDFVVSAQNNENYKDNPHYNTFMNFLEKFVELN
jgi:type II secretory pathway pseudopilin PulG